MSLSWYVHFLQWISTILRSVNRSFSFTHSIKNWTGLGHPSVRIYHPSGRIYHKKMAGLTKKKGWCTPLPISEMPDRQRIVRPRRSGSEQSILIGYQWSRVVTPTPTACPKSTSASIWYQLRWPSVNFASSYASGCPLAHPRPCSFSANKAFCRRPRPQYSMFTLNTNTMTTSCISRTRRRTLLVYSA